MKSFWKFTFASVLGFILASILLTLVSFIIVGAVVSSATQEEKVEVEENTLLLLKLNKPIVDRASNNPFENFNFQGFEPNNQLGLNNILKAIDNAKEDDRIKGVVLSLSNVQAGMANLDEIRRALKNFKEESGKFILSYADVYTQQSYYLASLADTVYMQPEGELGLIGLNAQVLFFKNMLDKVGVDPIILRHGKFKSAIEPFMMEKMSEANREQTATYLNSIWDYMVEGMANARGIRFEAMHSMINELDYIEAEKVVSKGLIDALIYKDEFLAKLRAQTGQEADEDLRLVSVSKYAKAEMPHKAKKKGLSRNEVAVVYAAGPINMAGDGMSIGGRSLSSEIRKARKDDDIKAIVLRVNSPGGSALASDLIWREVKLASEAKTCIVSMGDLAASGGYYISCAADTILANPTTITGSIGVFGLLFDASELLNEKIGITSDNVKTNRYADLGNPLRPIREDERQKMMRGIKEVYGTFIGHVSQGRGMSTDAVDEIGQGRVWSGLNAQEIGLVDEFGGLYDAIRLAAEMAGIEDDYRITELPEQEDPFKKIFEELTGKEMSKALQQHTGALYPYLDALKTISEMEGVQARLPYTLKIQ